MSPKQENHWRRHCALIYALRSQEEREGGEETNHKSKILMSCETGELPDWEGKSLDITGWLLVRQPAGKRVEIRLFFPRKKTADG